MRIIFRAYILFLSIKNAIGNKERIYSIQHNLGNGFQPRSSSIHLGIKQSTITTDVVATTTTTTTNECNSEDKEECDQVEMTSFRNLIENKKMYQLKVIDEKTNNEVIMSVPSCSVLRSNFREEVTLHLNPTGDLISMSYKPLISPLASKECDPQKSTKQDALPQLNFTTIVSIDTFTPSMVVPLVLPSYSPPPGVTFFSSFRARMSQQSQQIGSDGKPIPGIGPNGDQQQNQSFLRKYWYIILPAMIMTLSGGAAPEEEGEGAAGTAAVAGASAAAAKPRRGKRS